MKAWPVIATVLLLISGAEIALGAEGTLVRPEIVADVSAVVPGRPFTVGILYRISAGWHIYWQNPGDSGAATEVKFTVPQGFSVGDLRWPVPQRFSMEGGLVDYGYTDTVLLSARVMPPKDLRMGEPITIRASTQWLVCSDRCVPGEKQLTLSLPVAREAAPANAQLFAEWEQRLPIDVNSDKSPLRTEYVGRLAAGATSAEFTVSLKWKETPGRDVVFCPAPPASLVVEDVQAKRGEDGSVTIRFKARLLSGAKLESPSLPAVVAYTGSDNRRGGVGISVPLR